MKLQKLLYFTQGFYMKNNSKQKLFTEHFEAWVNGPVIPIVYGEYKYYGTSTISKNEIKVISRINSDTLPLIVFTQAK
jgi:uncharacterized phage-associated protein